VPQLWPQAKVETEALRIDAGAILVNATIVPVTKANVSKWTVQAVM
jgi:hypothetical protein